ncbi:MAG TPA: thioesterase family protein [Candidatus Binatia bacterium]|jgi:acyl-CoA thioester hydrolase
MQKNLAPYRVIYGDTDQMGVAYYANYLRWFEMGRTELLRQIGIPYSSVEEIGFLFPVTEVSCRYLKPARFDDEIVVETALTSLGRASLGFGYKVTRRNDGELLAEGSTRHACVDREGKVKKITSALETALKSALAHKKESFN